MLCQRKRKSAWLRLVLPTSGREFLVERIDSISLILPEIFVDVGVVCTPILSQGVVELCALSLGGPLASFRLKYSCLL